MENPFKYSGIVHDPYFVDRESEINILLRETENNNTIFLISPRRFGKTCLLFRLMDKLSDQGRPCAYIDLNACPDLGSFAALYTRLTTRALESNTDKLLKIFSGLKQLRPKASIGPDGSVSAGIEVAVEERHAVSALLEGIGNAETVAKKKKTCLTVIVDEFSDITKYDGETIEKLIRSEIQKHQYVSYIFSGSEQTIMMDMIQNKSRAFYKLGRIMKLGPIEKEMYVSFIHRWFRKGNFSVQKNDLAKIIDLGSRIPYNIQRICHNLWEIAKTSGKVTPELIIQMPALIVDQDYPHYEMVWRSITDIQRSLLIALSREPDVRPFSKEFQFRYKIGPSSSIKASFDSLINKAVLYRNLDGKYCFTDNFFPRWIELMMERTSIS